PGGADPRSRGWLAVIAGAALLAAMVLGLAALWPTQEHGAGGSDAAVVTGAAPGQAANAAAHADGREAGATVAPALADGEELADRIATASDTVMHEAAWQAMLEAWDLPHTPGDARAASACAPVLAPGTHCVRGSAHLERLSALGRPVLLQLASGSDTAWALLQGTDGTRVRLWLGGETFDASRAALQGAWPGRYAAVWRSPAPLAPPPALGMSGGVVDWLRERLVREGVADPAPPGAPFDEALAGSVRRFQRAR